MTSSVLEMGWQVELIYEICHVMGKEGFNVLFGMLLYCCNHDRNMTSDILLYLTINIIIVLFSTRWASMYIQCRLY